MWNIETATGLSSSTHPSALFRQNAMVLTAFSVFGMLQFSHLYKILQGQLHTVLPLVAGVWQG